LGFSLLVISIICVTRIFRNSKAVNIKNDIFDSPEELEMFTLGKEVIHHHFIDNVNIMIFRHCSHLKWLLIMHD
jgi:hypothetical protein